MALMLDFKTMKSLVAVVARLDGLVPFKTAKPRVVSAYVAPYADQYVEGLRQKAAGEPEFIQRAVALWAGTARTALMIPAGMVDVIGPVVEERPGETAVRMIQESLNGLFSLCTRLANIVVGPDSELPAFEKSLAQTEWLWFVASYIYAARGLAGRGQPGPRFKMPGPVFASPESLFSGTVVATESQLTISSGIRPQGLLLMNSQSTSSASIDRASGFPKQQVTDKQLAAALKEHGGNRAHAACELGISPSQPSRRILAAKPDSDLAPFKAIRGKGGRPLLTDLEVLKALEHHHGNRRKAARELGVQPSAIDRRVWRAPSNSGLAVYKTLKTRPGGRQWVKVDDDLLLAALEKHGGNRSLAAADLGIGQSTISSRIKRAGEGSPFSKYREIKGKSGAKLGVGRKASDQQIADALEHHQGDRRLAAQDLGMSSSAIYLRLEKTSPESPLAGFKDIRRKRGPKPGERRVIKVTGPDEKVGNKTAGEPIPDATLRQELRNDGSLAEILAKYSGNIHKAARQMRISTLAIARRIGAAVEGSPLFPYRNKRR